MAAVVPAGVLPAVAAVLDVLFTAQTQGDKEQSQTESWN